MKTAVSILHELMTQKKLPAPEYEFGDMVLGRSNIPEFSCTVTADNHSAVGKGSTKKEAKQNCVKNFLETYKCAEVILPTNEGDEDSAADGTGSPKAKKIKTSILPSCTGKENLIAFNYVGKLNEFSAIKRRPAPIYSERMTLTSGFLCVCKMEGIVTEGFGLNKKQAKQDAAKKMCLRLKDLKITPPSPTDIISPLTNKIPLAEVDVKAVLEKYSQLTMNTGAVHQDTNNNEDYLFSEKKYVPRIRTLPELRKELNNMGLTFKIENFQKSPCILSMTFDHDPRMVLMGTGESTQDAQKNMVTNASLLIDHGFTFQRSTNSIA